MCMGHSKTSHGILADPPSTQFDKLDHRGRRRGREVRCWDETDFPRCHNRSLSGVYRTQRGLPVSVAIDPLRTSSPTRNIPLARGLDTARRSVAYGNQVSTTHNI